MDLIRIIPEGTEHKPHIAKEVTNLVPPTVIIGILGFSCATLDFHSSDIIDFVVEQDDMPHKRECCHRASSASQR
jgi:hypothetical protein